MFTLVVALYVAPGQEQPFLEYEDHAATIMKRYGGSIERRIRIDECGDPQVPAEVHLVSFPDEQAFALYRQDADHLALAEQRAAAIVKTVVWPSSGALPT